MSGLLDGEIKKAFPGFDWLCEKCTWYVWRSTREACEQDRDEHYESHHHTRNINGDLDGEM